MVNLPKVSGRGDWKDLCKAMGLQARGTGGVDSASTGGTWDVSNADRIGKGEVDLVNILIEGAAQLVKWESALDAAKDEADRRSLQPGRALLRVTDYCSSIGSEVWPSMGPKSKDTHTC